MSTQSGLINMWYQNPQWWAVIVALLLGVLGIFLPIFHDWLKRKIWKPKFNIHIKTKPPDCHKIELINTATGAFVRDCYYLRFKVENSG